MKTPISQQREKESVQKSVNDNFKEKFLGYIREHGGAWKV